MVNINHNWSIIEAQQNHIPEIFAIAKDYDFDHLMHINNVKDGFLVSAYPEKTYKTFLTQSDHFYVALDHNTVVGFLLAFSSGLIPKFDWVGTQMRSRDARPFILIKQVAVRRNYLGKGLAEMLYQYLMERSQINPLLSVIVTDPPNDRSTRFHVKHGFEKIWDVTPPDGISRKVWCREPTV